MIEWLFEATFCSLVLMLQVLLWCLVGGFFINLWEVMMNWWDKVFHRWWSNR